MRHFLLKWVAVLGYPCNAPLYWLAHGRGWKRELDKVFWEMWRGDPL